MAHPTQNPTRQGILRSTGWARRHMLVMPLRASQCSSAALRGAPCRCQVHGMDLGMAQSQAQSPGRWRGACRGSTIHRGPGPVRQRVAPSPRPCGQTWPGLSVPQCPRSPQRGVGSSLCPSGLTPVLCESDSTVGSPWTPQALSWHHPCFVLHL